MTLGEQWPPHGHKAIKGFQRLTHGQRPKILVREKVFILVPVDIEDSYHCIRVWLARNLFMH